MSKFLGVHDMGSSQPEDKMVGSWEAYKLACSKLGISAEHAHISADKGRAYCLTEADTAEQVQQAHDEAQVPLVEIIEVKTLQ